MDRKFLPEDIDAEMGWQEDVSLIISWFRYNNMSQEG